MNNYSNKHAGIKAIRILVFHAFTSALHFSCSSRNFKLWNFGEISDLVFTPSCVFRLWPGTPKACLLNECSLLLSHSWICLPTRGANILGKSFQDMAGSESVTSGTEGRVLSDPKVAWGAVRLTGWTVIPFSSRILGVSNFLNPNTAASASKQRQNQCPAHSLF